MAKSFFERLRLRSSDFAGFLEASVVAAPIILGAAILHVVDPYNIFQTAGADARAFASRIIAPWWGAFDENWLLKAGEHPATVVLYTQREGEIWPPTFESQVTALRRIADHCPDVIAVDIVYDIPRAHEKTLIEALAETYVGKPLREGCAAPRIIFADVKTLEPGAALIDDIVEFVLAPCEGLSPLQQLLGATAERRAPCREGEIRAFAMVEWDARDNDRASPYFALDNTEFYRLSAHRAAWAESPGILSDVVREHADNDAAVRGRPTLALSAFMAYCAAMESRGDDLCAGLALRDEALARFGSGGGGGAASQVLPPEVETALTRPMALRWPRWPPETLARFSASPTDDNVLLGPVTCAPEGLPGFWVRLRESISMVFLGAIAGNPDAQESAERRCFPLMTLEVHRHLRQSCDEFTDRIDAAKEDRRLALKDLGEVPTDDEEEYFEAYEYFKETSRKIGQLEAALELCLTQQRPSKGVRDALMGKVVFVGFYAAYGGDQVRSPIHGDLPGVFRHAVAFENLTRLGEAYPTTPRTNIASIMGFPISEALAWEIPIIAVVTVISLQIAAKRENRRARFHRRLMLLRRVSSRPRARIYAHFLWMKLSFLERMGFLALHLLGIVALSATISIWMGWSLENWVRVTVLGAGSYTAGAYSLGIRARRASAPQNTTTKDVKPRG